MILKTWLERNIEPLAARAHPMFDYEGLSDPCLLDHWAISRSELRSHMHFVTGVPLDEIALEVISVPFHRGHCPNNVSAVSFCQSLVLDQLSDVLLPTYMQAFGTFSLVPPQPCRPAPAELFCLMRPLPNPRVAPTGGGTGSQAALSLKRPQGAEAESSASLPGLGGAEARKKSSTDLAPQSEGSGPSTASIPPPEALVPPQ